MSSFCHLIIISSKYVLRSVGRRDQPWHTVLLISTSLDSLELHFINILLCVYMSITAFNNVCAIFIDIKISSTISFCILLSAFSQSTNKRVSKLYYLHFSINNLRQNVGSVHKRSIWNPFCVSAVNCYELFSSFILRIFFIIIPCNIKYYFEYPAYCTMFYY